MQGPCFPDWRGLYHFEHLPGILCTSRNMFSGYIPEVPGFVSLLAHARARCSVYEPIVAV